MNLAAGGIGVGLVAGPLSGAFGIGGGVVLVPMLALLLGVSRHEAQASPGSWSTPNPAAAFPEG